MYNIFFSLFASVCWRTNCMWLHTEPNVSFLFLFSHSEHLKCCEQTKVIKSAIIVCTCARSFSKPCFLYDAFYVQSKNSKDSCMCCQSVSQCKCFSFCLPLSFSVLSSFIFRQTETISVQQCKVKCMTAPQVCFKTKSCILDRKTFFVLL